MIKLVLDVCLEWMQVQQIELETSRRRQHHLLRIDGALIRFEMNEFGFCFVCGEKSDEKRLSIDPTITRCLACADT